MGERASGVAEAGVTFRRELRKRPWRGPQGALSLAVQWTGQFSSLWDVCTSWPGFSTLPQQQGWGGRRRHGLGH